MWHARTSQIILTIFIFTSNKTLKYCCLPDFWLFQDQFAATRQLQSFKNASFHLSRREWIGSEAWKQTCSSLKFHGSSINWWNYLDNWYLHQIYSLERSYWKSSNMNRIIFIYERFRTEEFLATLRESLQTVEKMRKFNIRGKFWEKSC